LVLRAKHVQPETETGRYCGRKTERKEEKRKRKLSYIPAGARVLKENSYPKKRGKKKEKEGVEGIFALCTKKI